MKTFASSISLIFFILLSSQVAFSDPNSDLIESCRQGNFEGVKKAINSGANPNAMDPNGNSALGNAYFWPEITKFLLEQGADPNAGLYPPVISASNNYCLESLKLLLGAGADPNKSAKVDPGAGLRKMIEDEKAKGKKANKDLIAAWESALASLKPTEVFALQVTVQASNCAQCAQELFSAGALQAFPGQDGNLFHTYAAFGMTQEERKTAFATGKPGLEAFGIKVPDWYGDLPSNLNVSPRQMAEVLAQNGVNVNEPRSDGHTPLTVALTVHKEEVAHGLLDQGAIAKDKITVKAVKGTQDIYPICQAAEFVSVPFMEQIIAQGADINANTDAITLSMTAKYKGQVNFGGDGYTPLIISIMFDQLDLAKYLMTQNPNIKIGSNGKSFLETRFEGLNCPVEIKNKTPIYWAVERDDMELTEMIGKKMEWKFNPDFTIKQSSTGGGSASSLGVTYKCAKFKAKQSPSSYASQVGNKEASKFLSSKGL